MGTAADRREAFEGFVATAYEPLQRFLRRRTDPATADDVLGDVLLVLWRRVDDIPEEAPLAWAYGVARGCLANAVRSHTRQDRLVLRIAQEPDDAGPGEHDALAEALEELPEADRELLRLWAWEQLPPREIATVLGITANAASIRLHRAVGKLREKLGATKELGTGRTPSDRQGREAPND